MTRDGLSCFLGFQNFPGEDPRTPLPNQEMWLIFNTTLHNAIISKVSNSGVTQKKGNHIDLWWDGYIFVA